MEQTIFKVGDKVKCINAKILKGNNKGPSLTEGEEYEVKEILVDPKGYSHLDVGLKSTLSYVSCWETKEELERGDKIHWCHTSRFELV